jgi:predicted aspartyl protease
VTERRVVSTRIPYLPARITIPELALSLDAEAPVDTGFNAEVVLAETAATGSVPALLYSDVRLADGSRLTLPSYLGSVRIGDTTLDPVLVMLMGDEAIIGLQVITQFHLHLDHDRTISAEP